MAVYRIRRGYYNPDVYVIEQKKYIRTVWPFYKIRWVGVFGSYNTVEEAKAAIYKYERLDDEAQPQYVYTKGDNDY